ncbi:pyridoxine kinase [Anaerobranca californiensis DSM 14826]|jgi:pyridoxine kinase|uniref:pyridoxal kinase n=1 Tax=Anaerobranca californiensis DSM 14826 TaxID=1120989 RepID=A0A1M6MTW2_9FIRM|nr:pyridoxamine kinase [Anaerobranca californiensis]SHJ86965.1 pyridoxine kinase [Anaerobranca californiensis DSM 14826]
MESKIEKVPKVVAIHDMSGVGRCSLTVAIPLISSMGIQVCPLPTAILSSHLDGFGEPAFIDLTDKLNGYANHWKSLNIQFDCIYSGFIGTKEQFQFIEDFIDDFRSLETLVVIDPVMADNGEFYSNYNEEMLMKMKGLITKADVITPNLTEACLLLGENYTTEPLSLDLAKEYLQRLGDLGPKWVVITGVKLDGNTNANIGYSKDSGEFLVIPYKYIPVHYPGTGDVFASILTGGLMQGNSLVKAMEKATSFLEVVVEATFKSGTPKREGVILEKFLHLLR